jgi:hypothetical protein
MFPTTSWGRGKLAIWAFALICDVAFLAAWAYLAASWAHHTPVNLYYYVPVVAVSFPTGGLISLNEPTV